MSAPIINTADWLKLRTERLSASRFAAALGLDPRSSPLHLWSEMKGLLPSSITGEEKYIRAGKRFETGAMELACEDLKLELIDPRGEEQRGLIERWVAERGVGRVTAWVYERVGREDRYQAHVEHLTLPFSATIDGFAYDGERNLIGWLEAKFRSAWFKKDFADDDLDNIPPDTWAQLGAQGLCLGLDFGVLAPMFGGTDWKTYRFAREQFPLAELEAGGLEFVRYLRGDTPPPAMAREGEAKAVQAMYPATEAKGSPIVLPEPALAAWEHVQRLSREIREREAERSKWKADVLLAIGDAPAALLPGGKMLRRSRQQRAGYTVAACEFDELRVVNQPKEK